MDWRDERKRVAADWLEELRLLVLDAIAPWTAGDGYGSNTPSWDIAAFAMHDALVLLTLANKTNGHQYTALVCCVEEPEVVAVSFSDGRFAMLNPFLEAGGRVQPELDNVGCWQIFSVAIPAEPRASHLRYQRGGEIREVAVNDCGYFEIRDWRSAAPVDRFVEVKVDGKWQRTVADALPYSADHVVTCWNHSIEDASTRYGWLSSALEELGGSDIAALCQVLNVAAPYTATADNMLAQFMSIE